jgi:hypothetical protein
VIDEDIEVTDNGPIVNPDSESQLENAVPQIERIKQITESLNVPSKKHINYAFKTFGMTNEENENWQNEQYVKEKFWQQYDPYATASYRSPSAAASSASSANNHNNSSSMSGLSKQYAPHNSPSAAASSAFAAPPQYFPSTPFQQSSFAAPSTASAAASYAVAPNEQENVGNMSGVSQPSPQEQQAIQQAQQQELQRQQALQQAQQQELQRQQALQQAQQQELQRQQALQQAQQQELQRQQNARNRGIRGNRHESRYNRGSRGYRSKGNEPRQAPSPSGRERNRNRNRNRKESPQHNNNRWYTGGTRKLRMQRKQHKQTRSHKHGNYNRKQTLRSKHHRGKHTRRCKK